MRPVRILNLLSYFSGTLSRVYLPVFLRKPLYSIFSAIYKLNIDEAEFNLEYYTSFADFFTRNLKSGLRAVGSGLVNPADSRLIDAGAITNYTMIGIKGCYYSVPELLASEESGRDFQSGSFFNYYLAPGDYHHVHSPVSGTILKNIYVPGRLFPVTETFVKLVPNLYAQQERVVNIVRGDKGEMYAVVLVGAFNVGSIGLEYDKEFRANSLIGKKDIAIKEYHNGIAIRAGDRLGTFYLGSTVVVVSSEKFDLNVLENPVGSKVRYGEAV